MVIKMIIIKVLFMECSLCTIFCVCVGGVSLVAQTVENLPAMQETWVQSLGRENPLEKRMATFFKVNP